MSRSAADAGDALAGLAEAFRLQQAGRLDEAEAAYGALLAASPDDPVALINAGALSLARDDVAGAVARFARAVALVPRNAVARNNLGFALIRADRDADALAQLDRAVALKPDYAQAHNNRGVALTRLGRRDEAVAAFERARSLDPRYVDAAINLGDAHADAARPAQARAAYDAALAHDPANVRARAGRAFAAALAGDLANARAALEALVAERPDYAPAWQTLGAVANWSWDHAAAEAAFRRALGAAPGMREAQMGVACALLARGCYREGFAAMESRIEGTRDPATRFSAFAAWDGAPLRGTLLVHGEQGLGDVLQFARFLPQARRRAERLVLLLDGYWSPLAPLLASCDGADRVLTDVATLAEERIAARASILSLPHLLGTSVDDLPAGVIPYLRAPADRTDAWRAKLAGLARPRVGLAWSVLARDRHAFVTAHKSIPPAALAPLLACPNVSFVSIQPGAAGDVAALGAAPARVADWHDEIRDFGDTAALVDGLDLVIAPDTSVAHVAGALAKPVWLLDRFNCCWRWRLAPDASPWYPTMTIFRQSRFGDWTDVIERVRARLLEFARA